MIGIIAKKKENNKITEKSVKSILRKDKTHERLYVNQFGKVSGIVFNKTPIEDFHKKNFKGLFYFQYGKPLSKDYDLFVNIDESDYSDFTLGVLGYLKDMFNWRCSGHHDILSYCLQPFRLGITNPSKEDLLLQDNENIIVGCLKYNQEHGALVFAVKKAYLDEIAQKKSKSERTNTNIREN